MASFFAYKRHFLPKTLEVRCCLVSESWIFEVNLNTKQSWKTKSLTSSLKSVNLRIIFCSASMLCTARDFSRFFWWPFRYNMLLPGYRTLPASLAGCTSKHEWLGGCSYQVGRCVIGSIISACFLWVFVGLKYFFLGPKWLVSQKSLFFHPYTLGNNLIWLIFVQMGWNHQRVFVA